MAARKPTKIGNTPVPPQVEDSSQPAGSELDFDLEQTLNDIVSGEPRKQADRDPVAAKDTMPAPQQPVAQAGAESDSGEGGADVPPSPPEPQDPAEEVDPNATVVLGADAFSDMVTPKVLMTDDDTIPEGFRAGDMLYHPEDAGTQAQDLTSKTASGVFDEEAERRRAAASLKEDARVAGKHYPPHEQPLEGSKVFGTKVVVASPRGRPSPPSALINQIPTDVKFRSRIAVGAAYRYDGRLHSAPDWIDRNWAAYEEGPALNVPDVGIVKRGQWVVVQHVLGRDGKPEWTEIKVYDDDVFAHLFMPEDTDGDRDQRPAA